MRKVFTSSSGVIGLICLTFTPFLFAANNSDAGVSGIATSSSVAESNPVSVESRESRFEPAQSTLPYQPPIADEFSGSGDVSGVAPSGETQYQMQLLQQEVQSLRGELEELKYQLNQMRTTQSDRYLELDSRVQGLMKQGVAAGDATSTAASTSPLQQLSEVSVPVVEGQDSAAAISDPATTSAVVKTERDLYNESVELIRARQYDLAISQLEAVIAQYPQGQYTANAYYWLGEVHAAKTEPDYESARQALAQVITFFPEHRKVPDAAFKLGKVYHMMGDCTRASELLKRVISQHEGTTASRLAADYLRDRVGSCS